MPHVSIKPEAIFEFLSVVVTNSILATIVVTLLFISIMLYYRSQVSKKKSERGLLFYMFNTVLVQLHTFFQSVIGDKISVLFPLIACFFLFILLQNWFGLLPGVGSILVKPAVQEAAAEKQGDKATSQQESKAAKEQESKGAAEHSDIATTQQPNIATEQHDNTAATQQESKAAKEQGDTATTQQPNIATEDKHETVGEKKIPLFRGGTADLNMTLALGFIAVASIQYYGIKFLGLRAYLGKFFNFSSPIYFFIGILELVSEFSRAFSFSFRLFGNIIAGEILLVIIATLVPVLASFPFVIMEIFVGLIQAVVFSTLAAIFIKMAVAESH